MSTPSSRSTTSVRIIRGDGVTVRMETHLMPPPPPHAGAPAPAPHPAAPGIVIDEVQRRLQQEDAALRAARRQGH